MDLNDIHRDYHVYKYRGHADQKRGKKSGRKLLSWASSKNKRRKGRPIKKWEDEIKREFET